MFLSPLLLAAAASPSFPAPVDDHADGYELHALATTTDLLSATLSNGDHVVFSQGAVTLRRPDGTFRRTLHSFASAAVPSLLCLDPSETFAVFGDASAGGGTFRVGLAAGAASLLTPLVGSSCGFESADSLVMAVLSGPVFRWWIYRMSTTTGVAQRIAQVPGLFGTVAVSTDGTVVVGYDGRYKSPQAPGWEVARFDPGVLTGASVLTVAAAVPLVNGLQVVGALAIDPRDGRVFVAEQSADPAGNRILVLAPSDVSATELVRIDAPNRVRSLQFLPGDGIASFDPFQPQRGGALVWVASADPVAGPGLRRVLETERPALELNGPGTGGAGAFDLSVEGGPPHGLALVFYGSAASFDPLESALPLAVPLFVGLDLAGLQRVPGLVPLDANGSGSVGYVNTSASTGLFAIQAVLLDAAGAPVGSSSAAFL